KNRLMHHKIALSQYKRSPNNQSTMHSTTLKKKELINQNQKQKIITKKTELYVIKLNITT
ncbi:hypothetical protein D6Z09_24785, partial [Salmonella enterica subsp. enterica serovar Kentucky]|nr:hypothetical protein [Salmonella enterica subsp. enterica serovar Kentucky]